MDKLYKAILAVLITSSSIPLPSTAHKNNYSNSTITIEQATDFHEYGIDDTHSISTMNDVSLRQVNDWKNVLAKLAKNDVDEEYGFFSFIDEIRKGGNYNDFLQCVLMSEDKYAIDAILVFLSQRDKNYISAYEEDFVFSVLEGFDLVLQEEALDTILAWDSVSQLGRLKNIHIPNYYLQRVLESFLEEHI